MSKDDYNQSEIHKRINEPRAPWSMRFDKFMQKSMGHQILRWTVISILAFILLWVLWEIPDWISTGLHLPRTDLYDIFSISVNPPNSIEEHHFWYKQIVIVITYLFGAFLLSGVLITTLVNWVDRRKENWLKGETFYKINSGFTLILGGHKMVPNLCKSLLKNGTSYYLIIQTKSPVEQLRKQIESVVGSEALKRIILYSGDRASIDDLRPIGIENADNIYVIGENSTVDGRDHDVINIKCLNIIDQLLTEPKNKGKFEDKMPCHVMFVFQSSFTAFQYTDIDYKAIRFIPFNLYETWAKQVLIDNRADNITYKPLDSNCHDSGGITPDSDKRVHLIVVGMSKMGIAMAIQAAHIAHYPNFSQKGIRTLITFIDINGQREMTYFMGRYKTLFQLSRWRYVDVKYKPMEWPGNSTPIYSTNGEGFRNALEEPPYCNAGIGQEMVDIDWEFIQGNVSMPPLQQYLDDACSDQHSITTIALCLPETHETLSAAMYLPNITLEKAHQILVWQTLDSSMIQILREGSASQSSNKYRNLRPFGMYDKCQYDDLTQNWPSRLIMTAYDSYYDQDKAYLLTNGLNNKLPFDEFIQEMEIDWNNIKPSKGKSIMAMKWSNIYCASTIPTKFRSFAHHDTLSDEDIEILSRTEHMRWNMEQLLLGFRPMEQYQASMDKAKETELRKRMIHPSLTSFDLLTKTVQEYDTQIIRRLKEMYKYIQSKK